MTIKMIDTKAGQIRLTSFGVGAALALAMFTRNEFNDGFSFENMGHIYTPKELNSIRTVFGKYGFCDLVKRDKWAKGREDEYALYEITELGYRAALQVERILLQIGFSDETWPEVNVEQLLKKAAPIIRDGQKQPESSHA